MRFPPTQQSREEYHESRKCSRDTFPESYITMYTSIRMKTSVDISVKYNPTDTVGALSGSLLKRLGGTSPPKILGSVAQVSIRIEGKDSIPARKRSLKRFEQTATL